MIGDDSGIFRDGLRLLLEAAGVEVVAAVADGTAVLAAVEEHHPDGCVVDIRMPPTFTDEGVRVAERIGETHAGVGVLVLSTYTDPTWANRLLGSGRGGVGYLLKDRVQDGADLVDSLTRVVRGGTAVDPEVVASLVRSDTRSGRLTRLTDRETDVLSQMAQGRSNAGISHAMFLSQRTVESHIASIFGKLGLPAEQAEPDSHRRVLAVLAYLQA